MDCEDSDFRFALGLLLDGVERIVLALRVRCRRRRRELGFLTWPAAPFARRPAKKTARKVASAPLSPYPRRGSGCGCSDVPHRVSAAGATWNTQAPLPRVRRRDLRRRSRRSPRSPTATNSGSRTTSPGRGGLRRRQLQTPRPRNSRRQRDRRRRAARDRGMALFDDVGMARRSRRSSAPRGTRAARRHERAGDRRPTTAITIPSWRSTIAAVGDGGYRWLICSPDQLKKLIAATAAQVRFRRRHRGRGAETFGTRPQRTDYMRRITKMLAPPDRAPFLIAVTATPDTTPASGRDLSSLFAQIHGEDPAEWDDLGARLARAGLPLARRFGSCSGHRGPGAGGVAGRGRRRRTRLAHRARSTPDAAPQLSVGAGTDRRVGVELTPTEQQQYDLEWASSDVRWRGPYRIGYRTGSRCAARFRQKAE